MEHDKTSYFRKLWKGSIPLWQVFWGWGILGNGLLLYLTFIPLDFCKIQPNLCFLYAYWLDITPILFFLWLVAYLPLTFILLWKNTRFKENNTSSLNTLNFLLRFILICLSIMVFGALALWAYINS